MEINLTDFQDILVSPKTASKAREKGFFCITPHRYLPNGKVVGGWIGTNTPNPSKEDIDTYFNNFEELLIAPTPGILHEWLKRIHKISVHTEPSKASTTTVLYNVFYIVNKQRIYVDGTFTEESSAFDAGLYEALCTLH